MSWRLMGMETLRFILAKIPSVGLTSQESSFRSAVTRSCEVEICCHLALSTRSVSTECVEVRYVSNSSRLRILA